MQNEKDDQLKTLMLELGIDSMPTKDSDGVMVITVEGQLVDEDEDEDEEEDVHE